MDMFTTDPTAWLKFVNYSHLTLHEVHVDLYPFNANLLSLIQS